MYKWGESESNLKSWPTCHKTTRRLDNIAAIPMSSQYDIWHQFECRHTTIFGTNSLLHHDEIPPLKTSNIKYLVGCQGRYNGAKKRCYQGVNGGIWYFCRERAIIVQTRIFSYKLQTIVTTVTRGGCILFSIANAKVDFLFLDSEFAYTKPTSFWR